MGLKNGLHLLTIVLSSIKRGQSGYHFVTVTESADSGFNPLLRRPQGPQGCLEKQNCPLSSNLVVWCAKIGLKS